MKINYYLPVLIILFSISFFISCSKSSVSPSVSDTLATPVIISVYPAAAGLGDTVTISGKNFPSDISQENITINNLQVTIISSSADSIKFVITQRTNSGQIDLTSGNKIYSGPNFTYKYKAIVTTIAGTGQVGTDNGSGNQATFNCPWGITTDPQGNLYIADCYNRLIRKISAIDGSVSTITIPFVVGGSNFGFDSPYNIAFDARTSDLYVTDFNQHIMKIAYGIFSMLYIGTMPTTGIAIGTDGYLYVSNNTNGTILKMDTSGQNQTPFVSGLGTPRNIVFDKEGNMYVPGYSTTLRSSVINKITSQGTVTVAAMDGSFGGWEIAMDTSGNFYEADHFNNCIRMIDKTGTATTIAGSGTAADVDGIGLNASFNGPQGITIDVNGNLYVTTYNYNTTSGNEVRKIVIE
jgi:hypothetical protein